MGPLAQSERHDAPGLSHQLVPRRTAVIHDVRFAGEDPIRQPVVPKELPHVLNRIQLGRPRRKQQERQIRRNLQLARHVPPGLVHQNKTMRPCCHIARDLGQLQRHALCRAPRQNKSRALAQRRTDRPEDVDRGRPLVLRGRGTAAAPGPAPGELVLLPDPRLVRKPDL
jgi:hypothetical protein